MPGYELIGTEELESIKEIFTQSNGVLFAHGFDERRNQIYRVRQFEKAVANYFNVSYSTAVSSGTAACLIALKALGVGPGDEVITQAFTFVATVEAILTCGAIPIVVDCDETLNMCPHALQAAINSRTKCIMPVHMLGAAARMQEILTIAHEKNIPVIEDACEAMGGRYQNKPLGTLADIGVFSLDFGKTITTGEGGLLLTNRLDCHEFIAAYHDHGHKNLPFLTRGQDIAAVAGFNFRMTELQAAIGLIQLQRLNYILEKNRLHKNKIKKHLLNRYGEQIKFRLILDEEGDTADTLIFFLPTKALASIVATELAEAGIISKNIPSAMNWHYAALWPQIWLNHPYYYDCYDKAWEKTGNLLQRSIALNILVNVSDEELNHYIAKITKVLDKHLIKQQEFAVEIPEV